MHSLLNISSVYNPVYAIVGYILILGMINLPLFKAGDVVWHKTGFRASTLDGLRGLLAFGVFFQHAAIYHAYLLIHKWKLPQSNFYTLLGQVGVSLFFMITGYLFWNKCLVARGKIHWLNLYVGRLFRIGPLYLFATVVALLILFSITGLSLHQPFLQTTERVFEMLALGLFLVTGKINGYSRPDLILCGVTWSIQYEWLYYLLILPVSSIFSKVGKQHLFYCILSIIVYAAVLRFTNNLFWLYLILFQIGALCASLQFENYVIKINDSVASVMVLLILFILPVLFSSAFTLKCLVFLAVLFYLIVNGCSFFGLLNLKSSKRLGDASFSIYLLQGLVYKLVFSSSFIIGVALTNIYSYWVIIFGCALILAAISMLTYAKIELLGINTGRKIGKNLRSSVLAPGE